MKILIINPNRDENMIEAILNFSCNYDYNVVKVKMYEVNK
jgi:hypothetical protein